MVLCRGGGQGIQDRAMSASALSMGQRFGSASADYDTFARPYRASVSYAFLPPRTSSWAIIARPVRPQRHNASRCIILFNAGNTCRTMIHRPGGTIEM